MQGGLSSARLSWHCRIVNLTVLTRSAHIKEFSSGLVVACRPLYGFLGDGWTPT